MDKEVFLQYIRKIILDFETFKNLIENNKYKEILSYFKYTEKIERNYNEQIIILEHELFSEYTASDLCNLFNEFITYMSYLISCEIDKNFKNKVKITLSVFQDELFPIAEKILGIESLRFISMLYKVDYLLEEKVNKLCESFSFDRELYNYLIGYDLYNESYEQLSFIENKETKIDYDVIVGNRRFQYRYKLSLEISKNQYLEFDIDKVKDILELRLGQLSVYSIENELSKLKLYSKKRKTKKKDYNYIFTIK